MSKLDEELAEAVEQSQAHAPVETPVTAGASSLESGGASTRNLGLLAALLVMGGAILWLVFTSVDKAAIYSKGVDELVAEKTKLADRSVRVEGTLVKGTLKRRDEPCEYRFSIAKNGAEIDVRFPQCVVPDTFRDVPGMDVTVTAEGKLNEAGHFDANHIMAKCPSKYEMKERQQRGEKAPHEEITSNTVAPGDSLTN